MPPGDERRSYAPQLDPNAEREDPYGGRKKGEIEKFIGFMQGKKEQGLGL